MPLWTPVSCHIDRRMENPFCYPTPSALFPISLRSGGSLHSTLEEVQYASLLVQVVDVSSEEYARQMEITQETLQQIKAADIPMITVYNKCDQSGYQYPQVHAHDLYMSAKEKAGLQELLDLIHSHLYPG